MFTAVSIQVVVLGCGIVWSCRWIPEFRKNYNRHPYAHFCPKDEGDKFLRNFGNHIQEYTVSRPRRPQLKARRNTLIYNIKQEVLGRTNRLLSLIRHNQQFFYCMCICCRGNVFTERLPSNDYRAVA
jgi:hypothetical protein